MRGGGGIDVDPVGPSRAPSPAPAPSTASTPSAASPLAATRSTGRLAAAVVALPDRLLLVLLWSCVVVGVALLAGQHRPLVVLPAAVLTVAVTWRWRPSPQAPARGELLAAAACLLLVGAWAAAQLPLVGERLLVSRDPDIYTLTALWLTDAPAPTIPVPDGSDDVLGFDVRGGLWHPQGSHLLPGMAALLGWGGGPAAVLASGPLWGAAGLLGVFALARRVVDARWALLTVVPLGLSLPFLDVSRVLYTEPLTTALVMLGAVLLLDAWRSDSARRLVLAGVALGAGVLARADALMALVGVVAALTPLALSVPVGPGPDGGGAGRARRWGSGLVALGAAPLVAVGLLDVQRYTVGYWASLRSQVLLLVAVAVVAALAATALATAARTRLLARWRAVAPRVAVGAAGLLVLALVVLASRPLWLVGTEPPNPAVAAAQMSQGLPVEPERNYQELSLAWLWWYWGPVAVLAGGGALCAWLVLGLRSPRHSHLACLLLLVLPSALLYATWPGITPDQVWAVRRFLPVVVPGLLVGAAWALARLALAARPARRSAVAGRRALAGVLAVALVAWPAATVPGLWTARDREGARAGVEEVCDRVAGRPTVVTGVDTLAPTVRVVCGVPTFPLTSAEPTPAQLLAAARALGGGDVTVVTRNPDGLPWTGPPSPPVDIVWTQWETTLTRPPAEEVRTGTLVTVAALDPRGRVRASP